MYPTNDTKNGAPVKLDGLSGGERSKTLLFLIHSLWKQLASPFRALDVQFQLVRIPLDSLGVLGGPWPVRGKPWGRLEAS